MADSPVFISYDPANQQFAQRLATDLEARGVRVMPDGYAMSPDHAKDELLFQAQWLLLVRSPQAELSKRVHDEVDAAMDRTVSQHMQGVFSVLHVPSSQAGPPNWSVIRSFTATDEPSYERSLQALRRIISESQQAQSLVQASPVGARPVQLAGPLQPGVRSGAVGNRARKPSMLTIIAVATLIVLLMGVAGYAIIKIRSNSGAYLTQTTPKPGATIAVQATPTATPSPTPTATPIADPKALYDQLPQAQPTLGDAMDGKSSNKWDNDGTSCVFTPDGHYNITTAPGFYKPCMLQGHNYTNFVYQVSMTIVSGDAGGLIFRADQTVNQPMVTFYRFSLTSAGTITLVGCTVATCFGHYVTDEGKQVPLPVSSVQHQSTNTIAVIVSRTTFYLFVNKKLVTQVDDSQVQTGGGIGLYAASVSNATPAANVVFSDLKVWVL